MLSLAPRLAALRERGTKITTLLPELGAGSELATELGEVITGGPRAVALPRGPRDLTRTGRLLRGGRQSVAAAIVASSCELVLSTSSRLPAATLAGRAAGVGVAVYAGEPRAFGPSRIAARGLALAVGRHADAIVVPSHRSAHWQADLGLEATVVTPVVEPAGLDDGLQRRGRQLRDSLELEAGHSLIASLGALNEGRGQDRLIAALAQGVARGQNWMLMIGGESLGYERDDRYAAELRALARNLGVAERVAFRGPVSDPAAFCAAADVFVNPARVEESFGRAVCEALLAGTPAVSSRAGWGQDFLRPGRDLLVFDGDGPESIAAAIERLLADPALGSGMVESGVGEVRRHCAMPAGQAEFEMVLDRALTASRARTRLG